MFKNIGLALSIVFLLQIQIAKADEALAQFEKSVGNAIQEFQEEIKNLSQSNDPLVQSIDKVLEQINEGVKIAEQAIQDGNIEATINAIDLVGVSISETAAAIPSEKFTNLDHINMEETFTEEQLKTFAKVNKNKNVQKKEDMVEFVTTVLTLEKDGYQADRYVEDLNTIQQGINMKTGKIYSYTMVKKINSDVSFGLSQPQFMTPSEAYKSMTFQERMRESFVAPGQRKFSGFGYTKMRKPTFEYFYNMPEEENKPLEYWETEQYEKDFYTASKSMSPEEFSEKFPKWPDGYDNITSTLWDTTINTSNPGNIDWPGLNEDGSCSNGLIVCAEQTQYALDQLTNESTIVNYEDALEKNKDVIVNYEDALEMNKGVIVDNYDNINSTISEATESLSSDSISQTVETVSNTQAISEFTEQANNLNETIEQLSESIASESSITDSNYAESLDSFTETIESSFSSFEESMEQIQDQSETMAQLTETIKETLEADTQKYFEDAAKQMEEVNELYSQETNWPGLNSDGSCSNGMMWCQEQTEYSMDLLNKQNEIQEKYNN